jgi:hypothetical protein
VKTRSAVPPAPTARPTTVKVTFEILASDFALIERKAEADGMTPDDYVRRVIVLNLD